MGSHDDLQMDAAELYREETFTDRKVGTIRRLTPVDSEGNIDIGRQVLFVGETSLYTPMGTLPIHFQIEAETLGAAVDSFAAAGAAAVEQAIDEIEAMRREEEGSGLVLPGHGGGLSLP